MYEEWLNKLAFLLTQTKNGLYLLTRQESYIEVHRYEHQENESYPTMPLLQFNMLEEETLN